MVSTKTFLNSKSCDSPSLQTKAKQSVVLSRLLRRFTPRNDIGLKTVLILVFLALLPLNTSCAALLGYEIYKALDGDGGGGDNEDPFSPTTPVIEATKTYSIALGGVAPGRDELVIVDESGNIMNLGSSELTFKSDTDVVGFLPRPDYDDFASGSGTRIVPQETGFAFVSYYIDGIAQDERFLVIVPPQTLIQMMMGEANKQVTSEAEVDGNHHVKLDSVSETADAIGAVTRNRVKMIQSGSFNHSVFDVDEYAWGLDPLGSYYDSVITANNGTIYQYSPVDPADPTHDTYTNAEARDFLDSSLHRGYDQAVLSAAYIFSEETPDPTGGAFAFYSPTSEEWVKIQQAYDNNMVSLPVGCGIEDADFPNFDYIQIVILTKTWEYPDGRPAFVFIRERSAGDYVVVME